MKYILQTELNESGNKVFSKKRIGKEFLYTAIDENGNKREVEKDWILFNQKDIRNLGVDKNDTIYPVDIEKEITPPPTPSSSSSNVENEIKVGVMYYDGRIIINVYSEDTADKSVINLRNIAGIKFISQNGIELDTKEIYSSPFNERFKFSILVPNKVRKFTYRTDINKVKQELPKLKACIYSEKGYMPNETKDYLLVDMSILDIDNSSFSIFRESNGYHTDIKATMKCRLNVKTEDKMVVNLKMDCYFNDVNSVEYTIDNYIQPIFADYITTAHYGLNRYTELKEIDAMSKNVRNAVKCYDYINGMWSKWLSELTNKSLKDYYLDLYNSGKLKQLNSIPLYRDANIDKAINSLKKIFEDVKSR